MKLSEEKGKENPFRVPDDYFSTLSDRTMAAIRETENLRNDGDQPSELPAGEPGDKGHRKPGIVASLKPFLALAAAILGFAILAAALVRLINVDRPGLLPGTGNSLYADLAAEEIDTYIIEDELNITETVIPEMTEENIASEAIIDYLMTEDIDLNEIYELL